MIGPDGNREEVILKYEWLLQTNPQLISDICRELRNKTLGCFCAPLDCHGDLLVRIANGWQLAMPLLLD